MMYPVHPVRTVTPGKSYQSPFSKRAIENRQRAASRIEKVSTAGKVPVHSDSTPTPTTDSPVLAWQGF
jgi:hypothetical protein